PLVFLDGGMRVLMATWPAVLAWLATGLARPPSSVATQLRDDFDRGSLTLAALLTAVIGVALVVPGLAHRLAGSSVIVPDEASTPLALSAIIAAAQEVQEQWVQDTGVDGEVQWLQVDRRMSGPGVSVGNRGEAELTVMDWQRELQISGIGSEAYLLSRMPQPPFEFSQVYDFRSGTSKI